MNILLKFFFLSKKIIFFSPILANNNLPLKIYCENIMILFPLFFFSFFSLFFYPPHTYRISFSFFPFFSPPHMYPYTFLFLLLSSFVTYHFLQTPERSSSPSSFFFFFFFFFPFSLSTSFLPLQKIYPYSFLFFSFLFSFFPLFFLYSFLLFVFPRTFQKLTELSFSPSSSFFFSPPFSLSTSSVTPMQGIYLFIFFP